MALQRLSVLMTALVVAFLAACDGAPTATNTGLGSDGGSEIGGVLFGGVAVENDLTTDLVLVGSGIVADGVGLDASLTGSITVAVPGGASVTRVLLYWETRGEGGDPSKINVAGPGATKDITGDLIGQSTNPGFTNSRSFRADLTTEFAWGAYSVDLTVADTPNFNGASLVIVYDDGSDASVEIRDGDDFAYIERDAPNDATNLQTFVFSAETVARTATLWLVVGDVEDSRPTTLEITVDGATTAYSAQFGDLGPGRDGAEWDTYSRDIGIPAGVTALSVQLFSGYGTEVNPASLDWVAAGLSVPIPPRGGGEGCTPGYWKGRQHFDSWPAPYTPTTLFSDVFEDAFPGKTLVQVAATGGGGLRALGRHTVAALLNAASGGVSYDLTAAEVIAAFNAVYPGGDYEDLKDDFEDFNEQGCPLN